MSVNGINQANPLAHIGALTRSEAARSHQNGHLDAAPNTDQQSRATHATLKPQIPIAGQSASLQSAVPTEAPEGTDPALWSVLTSEERGYFARTAALGPLTYGRIKAAIQSPPPAARGVRLDVRA